LNALIKDIYIQYPNGMISKDAIEFLKRDIEREGTGYGHIRGLIGEEMRKKRAQFMIDSASTEMMGGTSYINDIRFGSKGRNMVEDAGIPVPPWGVVVLEGPSVEALRKRYFSARSRGVVLVEVPFDTFKIAPSPESRARFGVNVIQVASFIKHSAIASLRPSRHGGSIDESILPESVRLDLLGMIAAQGFAWVEIEQDIPEKKRGELISLARRAGSRVLLSELVRKGEEWSPPQGIDKDSFDGYKVAANIHDKDSLMRFIRTTASVRRWAENKKVVFNVTGEWEELLSLITPLFRSEMISLAEFDIGSSSRSDISGGVKGYFSEREQVWRSIGLIGSEMTSSWSLKDRFLKEDTGLLFQIGRAFDLVFKTKVFNAQFNEMGHEMVMIPIRSPSEQFEKRIQFCARMGARGALVEMPFRSSALRYMDWVDPRSNSVGSIDTIIFKEGNKLGYNSEIYGMGDILKKLKVKPNSRVLVLGTGASGRAAAVAASMMGMDTYIAGSGSDRTREMASTLNGKVKGTSFKALKKPGLKFDMIINSIPFETKVVRGTSDPMMEISEMVKKLSPFYGLELNITTRWTPFLSAVESRGGEPFSGVDFLVRSIMRSFRLMTGGEASEPHIVRTLSETLFG